MAAEEVLAHIDALAAENAELRAAIRGALGVLDALAAQPPKRIFGGEIVVTVGQVAQAVGDELRAALDPRARGRAPRKEE